MKMSWNAAAGCNHGCWYCYARKFLRRSHCQKCQAFEPHWHWERLEQPLKRKKPTTIFLDSVWDIGADCWKNEDIQKVLDVVREAKQHTFLALTKNPKRYMDFDLPENLWCGVTVTGLEDWGKTIAMNPPAPNMAGDKCYRRFISFEPVLDDMKWLHWQKLHKWQGIIIGPLNHKKRVTKREWILNLTDLAVKAGVPVFHKRDCLKQGLLRPDEMRAELAWR